MKMEIFDYLIAIEKYGSLNKAATQLYVSQPNLSQVLTSFEEEVGYPVLYRTHQGVRFTDQGKQVLQIAHQIVKEKEKLLTISRTNHTLHLKISIGNGDYALSPLFDCLHNEDDIHITIMNCGVLEALEAIYDQKLDLAYFIIPSSMEKQVMAYARIHQLHIAYLKELICEVNVREHHPLLEHFSKERLWNYPFVDFINQRPNAYDTYQPYINPNKIIEVDHHSLRSHIVSHTDAYSIGIPLSQERKTQMHIVSIPIPELKMRIYEARRQSDLHDPFYNHYQNEIEKILVTL